MAEVTVPSIKEEEKSDGGGEGEGLRLNFRRSFRRLTMSRKSRRAVVKHGHLRINKEDGEKSYKKTPSQAIMAATQLGISFSVGRLGATAERDVLMVDFYFVEKVYFPSAGTNQTPSHKYDDFRFKAYAPIAFRYFRDLFGIQPSDFMLSIANEPLREISNPGASGSLFFVSNDDMFIIKTVQHKEATFLQQLLPGYYMNIHQNPHTLLPKFFGLYCYQSGSTNIRLTVMNNILPSKFKCHKKYDLKGSTYKRKASKQEQEKKTPCWKDLDYVQHFPEGILLEADVYDNVVKTISRDVRVLESFGLMDYSFLLCVHSLDEAEKERDGKVTRSPAAPLWSATPDREARRSVFVQALESIPQPTLDNNIRPFGGIPARSDKGERLILFMGIIDILQNYRLTKKMEHGFKSLFTDGDTVSVHNPSFYGSRFLNFIKDQVFTHVPLQRRNTRKRSLKPSDPNYSTETGNPLSSSRGSEKVKLLQPSSGVSSDMLKVLNTDTDVSSSDKVTLSEPNSVVSSDVVSSGKVKSLETSSDVSSDKVKLSESNSNVSSDIVKLTDPDIDVSPDMVTLSEPNSDVPGKVELPEPNSDISPDKFTLSEPNSNVSSDVVKSHDTLV